MFVFRLFFLTEYFPLLWTKYQAAQGRRDKKGSAPAWLPALATMAIRQREPFRLLSRRWLANYLRSKSQPGLNNTSHLPLQAPSMRPFSSCKTLNSEPRLQKRQVRKRMQRTPVNSLYNVLDLSGSVVGVLRVSGLYLVYRLDQSPDISLARLFSLCDCPWPEHNSPLVVFKHHLHQRDIYRR